MNSPKTYIPSVILSIFLVFAVLASSAIVIAGKTADKENLKQIIASEDIVKKTQNELEKYFKYKYNETGVPSEVYTEALSNDYLCSVTYLYIDAAFDKLGKGLKFKVNVPENQQLEFNIETFFDDYAESINYEKDDNYFKKLASAKKSTYKIVGDYCDVYKLSSINKHGILDKADIIYRNLSLLMFTAFALVLIIVIILIVINRKNISTLLYWTGISSLIAGIVGIIPSAYLSLTNYFDAFVVKQPQIFTAFTSLMYKCVNSFIVCQSIIASIGIVLLVVYFIISKKKSSEMKKVNS